MTEAKPLTSDISVCAFVPPEKLKDFAGQFKTIINNRPDSEEPGQASSAEIEAAAERLGLEYVHIPVVPGQLTDDSIARFAEAVSTKPGPALAFCRTGTRSTTLWALSEAGKRPAEEIIAQAKAAGYDLSALKPRLEEKASQE